MRPALLLILAPALLAAAPARKPAPRPAAITSADTKLDLAKCTTIHESYEAGLSATWKCPGYAGIPLFVELGDERFDLDAGQLDHDGLWSDTFDNPPTTVEWRLKGGKPFAIIYRLSVANPDAPKSSRLKVETIGDLKDPAKFGCRIADIEANDPDANKTARDIADLIPKGEATCIES